MQKIVNCRCHCYFELNDNQRKEIFETFYAMSDHEMQNTYLRGCIRKKATENIRRRPRTTYTKKRNSFSYAVSVEDRSVVVCKAAFLGLHGIEASTLRRKVINFSVDTKDNRGKHSNHPKVEESIKNLIWKIFKTFLPEKVITVVVLIAGESIWIHLLTLTKCIEFFSLNIQSFHQCVNISCTANYSIASLIFRLVFLEVIFVILVKSNR